MLPIGDDDSARRTVPLVTYALIALNVLFFFVELSGGNAFIGKWAFVPSRFLANPFSDFLTLFTSMFMHAGWVHLGGNMLYLWIFGDNVEDRFGHIKFTIFYVLCGLAATFAQLAFSLGSNVPNLGASGAIAGVLGAYILLFPQAKVKVLQAQRVIQVPALIVIGLWIVLQFFSGIGSIANTAQAGGVAYMSHIGGFLAGFVLTFVFRGSGGAQAAGCWMPPTAGNAWQWTSTTSSRIPLPTRAGAGSRSVSNSTPGIPRPTNSKAGTWTTSRCAQRARGSS
jgi:membrane associated rhomboid family serine protease